MRWLICDEVAKWWNCGGSWGGKFEIIGSASLTMALRSGMVHREILLIKKRKQTNRFIFRLPLPPSLENKMFSVTSNLYQEDLGSLIDYCLAGAKEIPAP